MGNDIGPEGGEFLAKSLQVHNSAVIIINKHQIGQLSRVQHLSIDAYIMGFFLMSFSYKFK